MTPDDTISIAEPPPADLEHYKTTPEFAGEKIPAALLGDHSTKAGVWPRVVVTAGRLKFVLAATGAEVVLGVGEAVVCPPEAAHRVEPVGDAAFYVEFWRRPR